MGKKNQQLKKKIIKYLYYSDTLSVAELCLKADKSLPVISKFLNELIEEGLITETGYAASSGGRRPLTYAIVPNLLYVVSVSMDQYVSRIAIMNLKNSFVTPVEEFELPLTKNPDASFVLAEKIEEVITNSGIPKNKIAGVGIGMPGFVDAKKGINYTFLSVPGKNVTEYMSEKIGLPVFIDNDSRLIALAELRFGAARNKTNVMVLNVGWGVGLGMILNGELFKGHNGFAGEFSHIPLFTNSILCSCGKTGCLETETSLMVVIKKVQEGLRGGRMSVLKDVAMEHFEQAIEAIMNAAKEGDQFAAELFSETGYKIGRGVAILIHLFNPETVILSGRGSLAGKIWQAPIQQALNEHCIPRLAMNTNIEISTLGYHAELIGAAALVMENFERRTETSGTPEPDDHLLK
ncbi:ROK family transcriptional regulator [Segetibacter koreensis]|uniref:ROK family transcriptional regulator n=1 Tax=Segetibacter koreensis TaxID=398037 RepID=UPI000685981F|nr:ROK family transcriptional regulator [Segetibacter koreensis]